MKNFKEIWKQLSNKKKATNADAFAYCALRAFAQTKYDRQEALDFFLMRHYTPRTSKKWKCQAEWSREPKKFPMLMEASRQIPWTIKWRKQILQSDVNDIFDNEEEIAEFIKMIEGMKNYE